MYDKNLSEDLRLRLSKTDMDFLRNLSVERSCSISEVLRSMIGEYRRSIELVSTMKDMLKLAESQKGGLAVHGDTETNKHDQL